jgi:hypothetical protein
MGANPAKGTHDIIDSALAAQVCAVIDNSTTQENTEIIGSWSQIFSEFSDFLRVLRFSQSSQKVLNVLSC